jgi:hypothetical protein
MSEGPKVAMRKSRWHAFLRCAIHLVPTAAALSLVSLNWSQYYIGGELAGPSGQDSQKLAALQFSAKIHELLMLASITTVLFSYIRRELTFGDGVPFGAMFGGLQVNSISFLWSAEFWAVVYAEWSKRHKKAAMVSLLVVCSLLGVSVGPSTAVLMRPRLDNWPAGGTRFWLNAKEDVLSSNRMSASSAPSHCVVDTDDPSCPYGDWRLLSGSLFSFWPRLLPSGSMPKMAYLTGTLSVRELSWMYRSFPNVSRSFYANARTIASVPPVAVSDALAQLGLLWAYAASSYPGTGNLRYRNDNAFTVLASQPLVEARCFRNALPFRTSPNQVELWFPDLASIRTNGPDSLSSASSATIMVYGFTGEEARQIQDNLRPDSPASLLWFDIADLKNMTHGVINAAALLPGISKNPATALCCSIDARISTSTISGSRLKAKFITGSPSYDFTNKGLYQSNLPVVAIDAEWAKYLTPIIPGQNQSIFTEIASAAGLWNASLMSQYYNYEFVVESILATLIVNGVARSPFNVTIAGMLRGMSTSNIWMEPSISKNKKVWFESMIPKNRIGWGGNAYDISPAEQALATQFTMHATDNGYAYSYEGITQKAAMAVLFFYSLLALLHLVYTTSTGWTSTAWDSAPEIAALALRSEKSRKLKNTGAGIMTTEVFEERVRIRDKDGHLEYVFTDTEGGWRVSKNRAYC